MAEKRLTSTARKLRGSMTDAETRLWAKLRAGQVDSAKFVRQFPIGAHVVDFACRSAKLAIELDGGQHADSRTDENRTRLIEAHGFRVVRFWNHDVMQNVEGVLETIRAELVIARNL